MHGAPIPEGLDPTTAGLAVVVCILVSAFAASVETALTSLGEARSRQLVEEQDHTSLRLWIEHPERVLATLLVLNTIATSLSASMMTALVEHLGSSNAVAVATGLSTLLILSLGEITPKTLARRYAVQFAPVAMPLVKLSYWIFFPFVKVLGEIPKWIEHRLIRRGEPAPAHGERPAITPEEIEYLIDLGAREGVLDREKGALLTSVLDFADTVAREIMVPRLKVVALPIDASRDEVLRLIRDSEHSRIPVYEDSIDAVVGVLYVKRFLASLADGPDDLPFDLRIHLATPYFVPETMKITRLLREFQRRKVHLAVVVDEFGGTAGIVALEDVVEEIVGEIQDEGDVEEARLRVLADGTVLSDASVPLRDLEDVLRVDFPDERDADSLGGFLTATVGRVPPPGSLVVWGGLRFTVRAGDERHVSRVEISRAAGAAATTASGLMTVSDAAAEPADASPRGPSDV